MGARYDPFAVVEQRGDVRLRFADCHPIGVLEVGNPNVISLHYRLDRRQRRCVLAHELEHLEQEATWPRDAPPLVVAKVESRIDRATIDRLVPPADLERLAWESECNDVAFSAVDVMETFEVDLATAHKAMYLWETRR